MNEQFKVLKHAGHAMCSSIAELGGADSKYFDPMFGSMEEGGSHCFRTIMYPRRVGKDVPAKAILADGKSKAKALAKQFLLSNPEFEFCSHIYPGARGFRRHNPAPDFRLPWAGADAERQMVSGACH